MLRDSRLERNESPRISRALVGENDCLDVREVGVVAKFGEFGLSGDSGIDTSSILSPSFELYSFVRRRGFSTSREP